MVMLTLTRDNLNQIFPLTEILRGRTDSFTFNRLSQVGEGAKLLLPAPATYAAFLEDYLMAAEASPVLALKDNLINILQFRKGLEPFGGCTGFGCGAAFNFLTVLPDGEVHACRKLPSYLGNALDESLGNLVSFLREWRRNAPFEDDITVLGVEYRDIAPSTGA